MRGSSDRLNATLSGDREPNLDNLLHQVRACRICLEAPSGTALPHQPRPILRAAASVRLLIASQAPGVRAHLSGTPFRDASGIRLRRWMDLGEADFYDDTRLAIVPMGFCFPGHDAQKGDLPPRPECRSTWHRRIFAALPNVETILGIGLFGIRYHAARLGQELPASLDAAVRTWRHALDLPPPRLLPLPHPSWRNTAWLNRNPWFEAELLPDLRREVRRLMTPEPTFSPGSMAPV